MRHFILGTAGHVDHGKTELVKALTGTDTDRLKEEKERGISIELGFAPLRINETLVGIIDVPGHERFVKRMVAGAGGIDMAMLLVAGDEGVMPQTKEHLEVLSSLAISAGLVVISKCDLASDEMKLILREEITELVRGSFLEGAPIVETSARTGEGLETLKAALKDLVSEMKERGLSGPFRLPIDRVFHMKGIGVVITGSCYSGTVGIGDTLELLPSGKKIRVREIQSFSERKETGGAGERLAIALQGVKLDEVMRGEVLATPSRFSSSGMIDASLRLGTYESFELKNRERLRFHHGAKEVLGRVVLLDAETLRSGESGFVQMRLETPIVPGEGDCFVIRKYSPARVIGGGRILVPHAMRHRRFDKSVLADLALRMSGAPEEKLLKSISAAGLDGVREADLDRAALQPLVTQNEVVIVEGQVYHRSVLEALAGTAYRIAKAYGEAHPLRYGIDKEELRQKSRFPRSAIVFNRILEHLSAYRPLYIRRNQVRADTENLKLPDSLKREVDRLEEIIRAAGMLFLSRQEIEAKWKGAYALTDAVQFLRDTGRVIPVGEDGLMHQEAFDLCLAQLDGLFERSPRITVSDFKEACGLTRKHAIPLLELMDAEKVTARVENSREKGPDFSRWRNSRR